MNKKELRKNTKCIYNNLQAPDMNRRKRETSNNPINQKNNQSNYRNKHRVLNNSPKFKWF